jgi:MFS family permease
LAVSIFYLGYTVFGVPSNILLQKYGAGRWLAVMIGLTGVIGIWPACAKHRESFIAARFILGVMQAGIVPGIVMYLSYWYQKRELGARMGLFFSAASFSSALGGILAYF